MAQRIKAGRAAQPPFNISSPNLSVRPCFSPIASAHSWIRPRGSEGFWAVGGGRGRDICRAAAVACSPLRVFLKATATKESEEQDKEEATSRGWIEIGKFMIQERVKLKKEREIHSTSVKIARTQGMLQSVLQARTRVHITYTHTYTR